jgi:hypothetical protein
MSIGHEALILAANLLETGDMEERIPIRLRRKGNIVQGVFHGYWDMSQFGRGHVPAVSHPKPNGHMTTGLLDPEEEILDPIPSAEEWYAWRDKQKQQQQQQQQQQQ